MYTALAAPSFELDLTSVLSPILLCFPTGGCMGGWVFFTYTHLFHMFVCVYIYLYKNIDVYMSICINISISKSINLTCLCLALKQTYLKQPIYKAQVSYQQLI